jgi:hypothetical protein
MVLTLSISACTGTQTTAGTNAAVQPQGNRGNTTASISSDIKILADRGQSFNTRKAEIVKRWGELRPLFNGKNMYDSAPSSSAPYAAGRVNNTALRDAVNTLNFARFLAGLPDDVELRADYTELAQHGSVLNAAWKQIAHQQSRPNDMPADFYQKASQGIGSSNLHQGQGSVSSAVMGWIEDSDTGNRDRLGHRRWVLNPAMKYTGFGFANGFSSMYSFDTSRSGRVDYQAVCFPGGAAYPADFFGGGWAWSVSLNPDLYQTPNRDTVTVTLTEKAGGKRWTFSRTNTGSGYFNIETSRFGIPNCIIFLPGGISSYSGTYSVEISGLMEKSGKPVTLRYETTFFNIEAEAGPGDFQTSRNSSGITINKYTGSTKTVIIPKTIDGLSVTTIGKDSFTYSDINSITLPAGLKTIEEQSFWYSGIVSVVIPSGVISIGDQAFSNCSKLESISLSSNITTIGNFAFSDCKSLTTITIPSGVTSVGYGAFKGCDNLNPAIRSDLMKRFGPRAFGQ